MQISGHNQTPNRTPHFGRLAEITPVFPKQREHITEVVLPLVEQRVGQPLKGRVHEFKNGVLHERTYLIELPDDKPFARCFTNRGQRSQTPQLVDNIVAFLTGVSSK